MLMSPNWQIFIAGFHDLNRDQDQDQLNNLTVEGGTYSVQTLVRL